MTAGSLITFLNQLNTLKLHSKFVDFYNTSSISADSAHTKSVASVRLGSFLYSANDTVTAKCLQMRQSAVVECMEIIVEHLSVRLLPYSTYYPPMGGPL